MAELTLYTAERLDQLSGEAAACARRRKNLNAHPVLEDPIQRLFNAMEPDTYVRPHRHARAGGWELMLAVRGAFSILVFDDIGTVLNRIDLDTAGTTLAVEIPPFTWHALSVHQPGTLMFEVKPGPYHPLDDKDFAGWAPGEEAPEVPLFATWYREAKPGDRPPAMPRITGQPPA